ncbi:MAG: GNAT family N-acetyltransferase, partial [Amphiplicatus sp.]
MNETSRPPANKTPQKPRQDRPADPATKPKLIIRNAAAKDAPALAALSRRVYGADFAYNEAMVRGQINNFPDGQFVAEYEGEIVGHCGTFIISGDIALKPHSWVEITGGGFASRHNPDGDYLYGMEVSVHPDFRRLRIGQRFYRVRRELCENLWLKGIVFGGRMPAYHRRDKDYPNPKDYVDAVVEKKLKDPVVNFQLAQGFEPIGVLANYLPTDRDSKGYATHMLWRNPLEPQTKEPPRRPGARLPTSVRVATVQFQMRRITRIAEFEEQIEYFVDVAADYGADFVVFPELFTLQLLSLETARLAPIDAIAKIADYKERYVAFVEKLAVSYNINIIGGTLPTRVGNDEIRNIAYVFLRDGSVHTQEKLHPTPSERRWWNIKGGEGAAVIQTDCVPIGVMICYDSEFP